MLGAVVYVVQDLRSGEFLVPQSGDVGFTMRLKEAGHFMDTDEAVHAGCDHCDGPFDVVPVVCLTRMTH
jgi:hypothetical protein